MFSLVNVEDFTSDLEDRFDAVNFAHLNGVNLICFLSEEKVGDVICQVTIHHLNAFEDDCDLLASFSLLALDELALRVLAVDLHLAEEHVTTVLGWDALAPIGLVAESDFRPLLAWLLLSILR